MPEQTTNQPTKMSAYVRVSRVMGREGESYISPSVQEESIRKWAEGRGVQIIAVDKDEDQSGGTQDRPALKAAIARIEAGESDGIVVAKLNRFARNVAGAHDDIKRIQAAGGTVAFVEEGIDPTGPFGGFLLTILLAVATLELDSLKQSWQVAKTRAMERGVKIGPTPFGYEREADGRGRLVPHEIYGPVVTEAFKIAAAMTLPATTKYLEQHAGDERTWTTSSVRRMLKHQVYLGHLVYGDDVYLNTHEPLVTPARFELANRHEAAERLPSGDYPLSGFALCAHCGGKMIGASTGTVNNGSLRTYRCARMYSKTDPCPSKGANMVARLLEENVIRLCEEHGLLVPMQHGIEYDAGVEVNESDEAAQALSTAQKTYNDFLDEPDLQSLLGPERYFAQLRMRKEAIKTAQAAYDAVAEVPGAVPERHDIYITIPELFKLAESGSVPSDVPWLFVKNGIGRLEVSKGRTNPERRIAITWKDPDRRIDVGKLQPGRMKFDRVQID